MSKCALPASLVIRIVFDSDQKPRVRKLAGESLKHTQL